MFVCRELLLLCSIFSIISSAKPPKDGQPCEAEGRTGKCFRWDACAPIAEILQRKPVRESELIYAQKFICGYRRHTPYYCCVDGMSGQAVAPAPPAPQTPNSPNASDEDKGMVQNAVMNHRNRNLLPLETCGRTQVKYIVGGEAAKLGEFPWLALIRYKYGTVSGPGKFLCGGSLINKRYVMTAAHCLHPEKLFGFNPDMVRLGEHNTASDIDVEYGSEGRLIKADPVMDFLIETFIIHEDYAAQNRDTFHDIGLIRLSRDAPETKYVRSICLPTPEVDTHILSSKELVHVAGWGISDTGKPSALLMRVGIPIVKTEQCAAAYATQRRNVTTSQVCAGTRGKDSCKGDSGGPLMGLSKYSHYKHRRFFAVGVVSYGHVKCGVYEQFPGVYTRVLPYVSWILDHLKP